MKLVALYTTVILAIVIAALALWQMREAVQLLVVALAVASGMTPTIRGLVRRGLRREWAVALAFIITLALLVVGLALFGLLVYSDLATIFQVLPTRYDALRQTLLASGGLAQSVGELLPSTIVLVGSLANGDVNQVGALLLALTTDLLTVGAVVISVASLGCYWLLDQQRIERLWLSLLPLDARTRARAVWRQIYDEVGLYVRGEASIVAISAVVLLSLYSALHLPGAALLAVFGAVAQVVPLLSVPIALLPALLVALTQGSWAVALTLVGTLYALGVIRLIIGPRVFSAGANVNPVLVIVLILALAQLGGLWMILLAPPLAAAIQVSLRLLTSEQRSAIRQAQEVRLDELRQRLVALEIIEGADTGGDTRQLQALVARASQLVAEAVDLLPDEVHAVDTAAAPFAEPELRSPIPH
jgi:predicted PurR-regulated permease PerM